MNKIRFYTEHEDMMSSEYEVYRLQWMIDHRVELKDVLDAVFDEVDEYHSETSEGSPNNCYDEWMYQNKGYEKFNCRDITPNWEHWDNFEDWKEKIKILPMAIYQTDGVQFGDCLVDSDMNVLAVLYITEQELERAMSYDNFDVVLVDKKYRINAYSKLEKERI